MRFVLPFLLLLALPAHAEKLLALVRADRWAEAEAAATALPDPLARKLVLYFRLLAPGGTRPGEIEAFQAANPDWPGGPVLARRLAELAANSPADPATAARAAWVRGIEPAAEAAFLRQWGRVLTAEDQWRRFDRLAWTESAAPGSPAARQALRLDPARQAAAFARLALRRDEPTAPALFAALPASGRADPALVLELARWHRRAGLDKDAAEVWAGYGAAAEADAPPERRPAFWAERNELARRLLHLNDPAGAYAVASGANQSGEAQLDAAFLAGWIALRRLNQPNVAARHFSELAALSPAAITQGRAHYWLGCARAAAGDDAGAREAYAAAAAWPLTFYGQLAAVRLGDDPEALARRVLAVRDPGWAPADSATFAEGELARAAVLLVAWGEPRRAKPFLLRLGELAASPAAHALAARLASDLGLPDAAVAIARRAGRDGVVLGESGWPRPVSPPAGGVEPAVVLGLVRQESNFDAAAASPVGARGLMQLMPATAAAVARRLGEPASVPALTSDAAYNLRLGTAYLGGLLGDYRGALPLALAAYNAGPHRVASWRLAHGDPLGGEVDMLDWIEMIPFGETRNYVQRVIENVVIYRAQGGEAAPHPLAPHSLTVAERRDG